ncbi:DUF1996 domain-containing protein [Paractinoplanes maris]|uniref:DUF1996 domain-containing protein n=1 Tax=Paractinoplanes maris TaxID=1734446 RepID=UPI0020229883|nr:DUF1996 domain-containing protein [Actinoplanes maris]
MSYATNGRPDDDVPLPRHRRRPRRALAVLCAGIAVAAVAVTAGAVALAGTGDDPGPAEAVARAAVTTPPVTRPLAGAASPRTVKPSTTASAKAPAKAVPATTPARAAAKPGWIPVDQAAWKKQTAAYKSRKTDSAPGSVGNLPEFRADCEYSHRRADDPIVLPGLPGASHMHSFVGNKGLDADTTAGDLMKFTASTCKPAQDHSAYWVPTLYDNATGKPVETTGFRVYYRSLRNSSGDVMPMPNGLRLIAGDAKKKVPTPRGAQGQFYCAFYGPGDLDGVARSDNGNWPICGKGATFHFMMQFPDCWDGKHLDSPTHKAHVAFGDNQGCPASHPVRIPAITFDIQYGVTGTKAGYYLSSDKTGKSASSMHGDAFVMWDADFMNKQTKNCIRQRRTCDNNGFLM